MLTKCLFRSSRRFFASSPSRKLVAFIYFDHFRDPLQYLAKQNHVHFMLDIRNLPIVLEHGIQPTNARPTTWQKISTSHVMELRANRLVNGKPIPEYSNFYFQPRNAMVCFSFCVGC